MPELLLELGCEELPASFVRKAYTDLEAAIACKLREANISFGASQGLGTPRRLIVTFSDVAERQPDSEKEQRGPALAAAFDAQGNPSKALEGFCRSQGISVADVRKEGEYVWVKKTILGRPTKEVLRELLPDAIRGLSFDKAMRWGTLRMRFARPIRWILAAYSGGLVDFEIDGIRSGLESRGHRFNFPGPFETNSFDRLVRELRSRDVEPDPGLREERIRSESARVASGTPQLSEALVEENVFLTEWPVALEGSFQEEFLDLPEPVLVTAMAKHEKFFPVVDHASKKLTNRFVSIRNGGVDEVVREGNSRVLNARFNDAKFFFEEDQKSSLEDFLERTKGIVFQDKLGSVHQGAMRLGEIASAVAKATGGSDSEVLAAGKAGLYAKADLSSGLVSELPGLQGLIGAEYAKREGLEEPICWALATQYDFTQNQTIESVNSRTAARLVIADQLDKLAGYLGIGQIPKGSSDPYGLRRAATVLIEIALRWPGSFPGYKELFEQAQDCYRSQGFSLSSGSLALSEIFRSRYNAIFSAMSHDLVDAAVSGGYLGESAELNPKRVQFKLSVLEKFADDVPFIQTATRPQNILSAAVAKNISFAFHDPLAHLEGLDSREGEQLALVAAEAVSAQPTDAEGLIRVLKTLEGPINAFFDSTMVMAEDEQARFARLSLLHGVNLALSRAGDFSKIVVAG